MKPIRIRNEIYCLSTFARHYHLSYSTVRKYYNLGYHDEKLLMLLQKKQSKNRIIKIKGRTFNSILAAAKYYQIPRATFYRYFNKGRINELLKNTINSKKESKFE